MTRILAIDPGNTESAYALIHQETHRPIRFGKIPNGDLLDELKILGKSETPNGPSPIAAIEMVASYGMPVGREVFETCVWIGRYQQMLKSWFAIDAALITRNPVKIHHCHSGKAKDSNIVQALVDRFAPGQPNKGKGTKNAPGWFHGFAADVWQAYALAVYVADTTPISAPAATPSPCPAAGADPAGQEALL